jgi:hypothetical protein
MQLSIVMAKAQGKFIANPAHRIDFCLICTERRHWQTQRAAAHNWRPGTEHHVQLIVASDGANSRRGRTLERL